MPVWRCAVLKGLRRAWSRRFPVAMARGKHLFPFRTEQLSPSAPMVLGSQEPGRVGRRRLYVENGPPWGGPFALRGCEPLDRAGRHRRPRGSRTALDGLRAASRRAGPRVARGEAVRGPARGPRVARGEPVRGAGAGPRVARGEPVRGGRRGAQGCARRAGTWALGGAGCGLERAAGGEARSVPTDSKRRAGCGRARPGRR
jgi:hypothetical protein